MGSPQLRLVTEPAPAFGEAPQTDARRIFEHWLFMAGRNPRRCKMGPTRSAAINGALAMGYDVDTLLLAVEGMAADPLADCENSRIRDAMREIEWLLGREARIERWAEAGERVRERARQPAAAPVADAPTAPPTEAQLAAVAAQRERLRSMADEMRRGVRCG